MKWYEFIGLTVLLCIIVYGVISPLLGINDIHRSIDRLTNEIKKWREENNKREENNNG